MAKTVYIYIYIVCAKFIGKRKRSNSRPLLCTAQFSVWHAFHVRSRMRDNRSLTDFFAASPTRQCSGLNHIDVRGLHSGWPVHVDTSTGCI